MIGLDVFTKVLDEGEYNVHISYLTKKETPRVVVVLERAASYSKKVR